MTIDSHPDTEPRLVMPDRWVVDPLVHRRLARRLARLDDDVAGVVAPCGPLPAGSSYRVHAERLALDDRGRGRGETTDAPVYGAALVRPGVDAELGDDGVRVPGRLLHVDHGAHVHDPWTTPPAVEPADPRGRSPFPRRPVVLFLKTEHDDELDLADWSRTMVNGLVRHDVEGRIARAAVSPGLHLTRACLPTEESVHALRPEVVVILDDEALELATGWCAPFRSTVFVEYSLDSTLAIDIVPWRLGTTPTRVRARVGQAVDVASFARLVNRLCAGPQPLPPDKAAIDLNVTPLPVPTRSAPAAAPRSVAVVRGGTGDRRLSAFLEHASLLGSPTSVVSVDHVDELGDPDVVFVESSVDPTAASDLVRSRMARGRRTIVDVGRGSDDPAVLAVVDRAGWATAASKAARTLIDTTGARTQLLPTLPTPTELGLLASRPAEQDEPRTLLLRLDDPALATSITEQVQTEFPHLSIRELGADEDVPGDAVGLVWRELAAATGRPTPLLQAALLGVPSLHEAGTADTIADPVIGRLTVAAGAGPSDWQAAVRELLGSATPEERHRVAKRADALYGPKATAALVRRILGWASHEVGA